MGWIGQGTQNVKNRADAQFFANGSDVFHGAVIFLGEHEAETDFL